MKIMKYYIILMPILMLFFSCNRDIKDIVVQGMVCNAENKEPIRDIDITVICWKYGNSPDESYSENETKIVKTDNDGMYEVCFDKGAFVEVKVSLENYTIWHESRQIYDKKSIINIPLIKSAQEKK